uniref:Uncharacterized protein n=1 Tax=Salix viminalis TaxID=40686 RepID=A0A6N2L6T8_SALVM
MQTHLESLKSLQMKNQKDQNSGQDSAAQEVPLKTEIEGQKKGEILKGKQMKNGQEKRFRVLESETIDRDQKNLT